MTEDEEAERFPHYMQPGEMYAQARDSTRPALHVDIKLPMEGSETIWGTMDKTSSALGRQEGGDHYKKLAIQPIQYIHANGIGFCEGSVIKYVTRWRDKGGIKDLEKARHFLDLLIEMESKK